jgi:hypothetical protein
MPPVVLYNHQFICTISNRRRRRTTTTTTRPLSIFISSSSSSSSSSSTLEITWSGGGTGKIEKQDRERISGYRTKWIELAKKNLTALHLLRERWALALEVFSSERRRCGLNEKLWFLGWHEKKSYVGKTYMVDECDDDNSNSIKARGEIYVSKYALLDDDFEVFVGVLRHEIAHAICGPYEDHGEKWVECCKLIECDEKWICEANKEFYVRPMTTIKWARRDAQIFFEAGKDGMFKALPVGCFERHIYDLEGRRTVYETDDGEKIDPFDLEETYSVL